MTIIEQIKNNDPSLTSLVLDDLPEEYFSNVSELTQALENNTNIEVVKLEGDFIGCLLGSQKTLLLGHLGKLPSVREIHLCYASVMAQNLADMCADAKGLEILDLQGLVLQGIQYEFNSLERILRDHPKLKEVNMVDLTVANTDITMDRIIKTLKTNPSLQVQIAQ